MSGVPNKSTTEIYPKIANADFRHYLDTSSETKRRCGLSFTRSTRHEDWSTDHYQAL